MTAQEAVPPIGEASDDEPDREAEPDLRATGDPAQPRPVLVSLHYLRAALRRRRLRVLLSASAGLVAAGAYLTLIPAGHTASMTLVLAHDRDVEPARAMATDESLLHTRVVAERTVAALGLALEPQALLASVTAEPTTSDVLVLSISAPSDTEAVRRLTEFSRQYLAFRGTQVAAQSEVLIAGNTERITVLTRQVDELSRRIRQLSAGGADPTGQLGDAITQRAQVTAQINTLEQAVQEATLDKASVVSASRVVDPAAAPTGGRMRRLALTLASGLIAGTSAGVGAVLVAAITSTRLRLRIDVAAALETPVMLSVQRLVPRSRWWRILPGGRARAEADGTDLARAAHVIEQALPPLGSGSGPARLVVAGVDNAEQACFGVAAAAVALTRGGRSVRLVDLTGTGRLEAAVARLAPGPAGDRPPVERPGTVPSPTPAAPTPDGETSPDGEGDADGTAKQPEVCLVLADLDPAFGAYHLADWASRVLVAVTGGRSTAERVRTAGDLVRAAGLELSGALLLRADPRDGSSGTYLAPLGPLAPSSRSRIRPVADAQGPPR